MVEPDDTRRAVYTDRLVRLQLQPSRWKRMLDVQAPYRWNIRRLLGNREVLDIGCGLGRNLSHLDGRGVGIDHNEHSVRICRQRGLQAYTSEEFEKTEFARPGRFGGLLAAHLIEHLERAEAIGILAGYLGYLAPGATVVLICPQQRGFASDGTHLTYTDLDGLTEIAGQLGLSVTRRASFPLPRLFGSLFTYNEFVLVATYAA